MGTSWREHSKATPSISLAFIRPALPVLGQEIDGVAFECSLQLDPIKISAQLFSLLLQLHPKVNRCAVKIRIHHPSPGNTRVRGTRRFLTAGGRKNHRNKQQQTQDSAHGSLLAATF